jgi:hypothetical protein
MSVDVDKLLLRHKSGSRVPILIVPATRVVRRGQPAVIGDIKTGMSIVVLYCGVNGSWTAEEIRLFGRALGDSP